jgi:hypothetical protein
MKAALAAAEERMEDLAASERDAKIEIVMERGKPASVRVVYPPREAWKRMGTCKS